MENLKSIFQDEFRMTRSIPWSPKSDGNAAGNVRATGGARAGNFTFIEVLDAGYVFNISVHFLLLRIGQPHGSA
jgi:hypothetical protein